MLLSIPLILLHTGMRVYLESTTESVSDCAYENHVDFAICRYTQPETPNWKGLVPVLRRASRHFSDKSYEAAICTILGQYGDATYYARSVQSLVILMI